MMELKVYNPEDSFLKRIEWNYEELKNYIEPISAEYAASVYTDEMIKKAKEDRAKLNKFKDALEAEKSRVRKGKILCSIVPKKWPRPGMILSRRIKVRRY